MITLSERQKKNADTVQGVLPCTCLGLSSLGFERDILATHRSNPAAASRRNEMIIKKSISGAPIGVYSNPTYSLTRTGFVRDSSADQVSLELAMYGAERLRENEIMVATCQSQPGGFVAAATQELLDLWAVWEKHAEKRLTLSKSRKFCFFEDGAWIILHRAGYSTTLTGKLAKAEGLQ